MRNFFITNIRLLFAIIFIAAFIINWRFDINLMPFILIIIVTISIIIVLKSFLTARSIEKSDENLKNSEQFVSNQFMGGKDFAYFKINPLILAFILILILGSMPIGIILEYAGILSTFDSIRFVALIQFIGIILLFFSNFVAGRFWLKNRGLGLPVRYLFIEGTAARIINFVIIIFIVLFIFFIIINR